MLTENADRLRDHWWPRPGWRPGGIALTWHLTFEDAPTLAQHVLTYHDALAGLPGLNPVPPEWLHLTIQSVGYTDEISPKNISAVIDAVRVEVAKLAAFDLTFGQPIILGEAIAIPPEPNFPVKQLRTAIRAGIATVLGDNAVQTSPEQARGFRPHVSVAYSHADVDATPYAAALARTTTKPVTVPITAVTLIRQDRQLAPHWLYRWTTEETATLLP